MRPALSRLFPERPAGAPGNTPCATRRPALLVFPHAGAGASAYCGWGPLLAPGLDVLPLRLPGREDRRAEPPRRTVAAVLEATRDQWEHACRPPYAVFGHSAGALLAFELVRTVRREGGAGPSHLIVSGRVAPHVPGNRPALHDLPCATLAAHLGTLGGTPPALLEDRAFQAMVMPVLRADLAYDEDYEYVAEPRLTVPITVLSGTDDPLVWHDGLSAWAAQTTGAFSVRLVRGGHFFLAEDQARTLACIQSVLGLAKELEHDHDRSKGTG